VIATLANAVYYYSEKDTERCFKDSIVGNYVSAISKGLSTSRPFLRLT